MQLNFDARQVPPSSGAELIPDNTVAAMAIEESEGKPTKDGSGSYLQLKIKILEGPYTGRIVFDQLNLSNPNAQAVEIAQKRLSAFCHATGVIMLQDSAQLHGIPFRGLVRVKGDPNGVYDDKNVITIIKHITEQIEIVVKAAGKGKAVAAAAAPALATPATPPQSAPPAAGTPPWMTGGPPAPSALSLPPPAGPPWGAPTTAATAAPPPAAQPAVAAQPAATPPWMQPGAPVAAPVPSAQATATGPAVPPWAQGAQPAQPASPPPPAAPPAAPAQPQYKPGDIVNGHQLDAAGRWNMIPQQQPAQQPAPPWAR